SRENSRDSARKRDWSPAIAGSASRRSSSSRRSASASSLRRRVGSIVVGSDGWQQGFEGAQQVEVAACGGVAHRRGRYVQQAIGERMGELVDHGARILAGGNLLARAGDQLDPRGLAMRAQPLERLVACAQ